MQRFATMALALAASLAASEQALADDSATPEGVSLEVIMADPEWLGRQPGEAWWSWDGSNVYYRREREDSDIHDLWRVPAEGGEPERVADAETTAAGTVGGTYNRDGSLLLFENNGDIFLRDMGNGELRQLTRTPAGEQSPRFMTGERAVTWRVENDWYVHDLESGGLFQLAEIRTGKDPLEEETGFDYLESQQERLFSTLREEETDEKLRTRRERESRAADPHRVPPPFFLGEDVAIQSTNPSPDGRYMLVVTEPAEHDDGKQDQMPQYVTDSGYVEHEQVRTLVGLQPPAAHAVWLLNLAEHEKREIDLDGLPGIKEDPLADLREEAEQWHVDHGAEASAVADALEAPDVRPVRVTASSWTRDGSRLAIQFHSVDNKDRWLATVEPAESSGMQVQDRLTDPAWINWYYNEFDWLPDNETLWFLSEESGYSHLYLKPVDGRSRQLTEGDFVVSSPQPTRDGGHIFVIANREHPGWHDVYRVDTGDGDMSRVTAVGVEPAARAPSYRFPYVLSPDEERVIFYDGSTTRPPELHVKSVHGNGATRLTHTVSEKYLSLPWTEPEIVEVPSSHTDRPINARLYLPDDFDASKDWPAVVFVHGAGYLQNAHHGWSSYFREFMFHTLLNLHGYVVLDMDYRASQGYGRDWRTAIYRRMGHPELEDILDGVSWLTENHGVDEDRIGIYGGSYGGFMTFMAMFRSPETFAAGGSLRPVTDWVHYNHGYTSNILNTPLVDPMAYERSSPIEYAENYGNRPLAIFHGMQDDNVFFKDTVRLVQRLIELKKENYYPMFYPLDPHGFEHPESWLDEYRRIFALFEEHVK